MQQFALKFKQLKNIDTIYYIYIYIYIYRFIYIIKTYTCKIRK